MLDIVILVVLTSAYNTAATAASTEGAVTAQPRPRAPVYEPLPRERRLMWMSELTYAPPSQLSEEDQYARAIQQSLAAAHPTSCPPPIATPTPIASTSSAPSHHHHGFKHRFHRSKSPGLSSLGSEPVANPLSARPRAGTAVSTLTTSSTSSGSTSSSCATPMDDIPSYEEAVSASLSGNNSRTGSVQHSPDLIGSAFPQADQAATSTHSETHPDINGHSHTPTLLQKFLHRHKLH